MTEREPVAPLKFAQLVGFVFAAVGHVGFATGLITVGLVLTAFALVAAFLNAAFGICLGCQLYPLVARFSTSAQPQPGLTAEYRSNRRDFIHGTLRRPGHR